MELAIKSPRIRYYLGSTTAYLGITVCVVSIFSGITGIIFISHYGDLLRVGNSTAGPGMAIVLILEGLLINLVPAALAAYLGICIKVTLTSTMKMLRGDRKRKKKHATVWKPFHQSSQENNIDANEEEASLNDSIGSFTNVDDYLQFQKVKAKMVKYADETPKYLWYILLAVAITDFCFALVCFLLTGRGGGSSGLADAMRNYGSDPSFRRAVDWVQSSGWCCGDQTYTEWFMLTWCTDRSEKGPLQHFSDSINICPANHKGTKYDVPPSCCNPPRGPCIHHALDILGLGPLNLDGCSRYLEGLISPKYMGVAWLNVFTGFCKLILMAFVLLLGPSRTEKGTDEESSNLLAKDGESSPKKDPKSKISEVGLGARGRSRDSGDGSEAKPNEDRGETRRRSSPGRLELTDHEGVWTPEKYSDRRLSSPGRIQNRNAPTPSYPRNYYGYRRGRYERKGSSPVRMESIPLQRNFTIPDGDFAERNEKHRSSTAPMEEYPKLRNDEDKMRRLSYSSSTDMSGNAPMNVKQQFEGEF